MKHFIRLLVLLLLASPAWADSTTSALPNGGLIQSTDMIPIVRCNTAGCNYHVTVGPIASLNIGAGLGSSNGSLFLEAPTNSVLGGVFSLSGATSHQYLTYIDSSGAQHSAQPSVSDISGLTPAGIGAPTTDGTGATGNWSISITGNAATVTTNANLTGPITSSGNATAVASQTGTGSTFVMATAPALNGAATLNGNSIATLTGASLDSYYSVNSGVGGYVYRTALGVWGIIDQYTENTCQWPAYALINGISWSNYATLTTPLQNFLLDCEIKAYKLKNYDYEAQSTGGSKIDAYIPRFIAQISSPIVNPDQVRLHSQAFIIRNGQGTNTCSATNWDGSDCNYLANTFSPAFYNNYAADIDGLTIQCKSNSGGNLGSCMANARSWVENSWTIVSGGTGYTVGNTVCDKNPSKIDSGACGTVASVDPTTHAVTSITFAPSRWSKSGGEFNLPLVLQKRQWCNPDFINSVTTVPGNTPSPFYVFDPNYGDGCTAKLLTGGSGTGASITATYFSDFSGGAFDGTYSPHANIIGQQLKNIQIGGGGNTCNDSTYGSMFGLMNAAQNGTIDHMNITGGCYSWWNTAVDDRITDMYTYAGAYGARIEAGVMHLNNFVVDSPITGCVQFNNLNGMTDIQGGACFENSSGSALTDYALTLSSPGSSGQRIGGLVMSGFLLENLGGPGALYADYLQSGDDLNIIVKNTDATGAAWAHQTTNFATFGTHNQTGFRLRGLIDNVSGSIFTGNVPAGDISIFKSATGLIEGPQYRTSAEYLPSGTSAQQPSSPIAGMIRYNSDTPGIEGYYSSGWHSLTGSVTNNYTAGNFAIQPSSYDPGSSGNIFPYSYVGSGGNAAGGDAGYGVAASLSADSTLGLRFQMPPVLPSGTFKLVSYCLANASTGTVKYTVSDVDVAVGSSPSAATLTGETQTSITWSAADVYVVTKTPLTHSTPITDDTSVVAVTFNHTGWTLAQIMACKWVELWE